MTGTPWLSVVMPTYNGARWVSHALESVARQPVDGLEVLIVDDGSSDGTLELVRAFEGSVPLRRIPHQPGGNWVRATNVGLRAARGRHACLLHQDDLWLPGRIEAIRNALARAPEARLLLHPTLLVGANGERLGAWGCPLQQGRVEPAKFVERLLVQNFIAIPAPVFDTQLAVRSGGLDESLWYTADWDLWLRLGAAAPVCFLDQPLAAFRVHTESQTLARRTTFDERLNQLMTVLERHLERWPGRGSRRREVRRVAELSARVNAAFAAAAHGQKGEAPGRLLAAFLALGPLGWRRYLRDSRIVERAVPRARLRLQRRDERCGDTPP